MEKLLSGDAFNEFDEGDNESFLRGVDMELKKRNDKKVNYTAFYRVLYSKSCKQVQITVHTYLISKLTASSVMGDITEGSFGSRNAQS